MKHVSMFVTLLMVVAIVAGACAAPTATPTAAPTQPAAAQPTTAPAQPTQPPAAPEPTKAPEPTAEPAMELMGGLPMVDAGAVTGDIVSAGSSTVFPLSEAMAARFQDEGYKGNITIDSIGSGAGFERYCKTGETDIANASRAIKSSEVESCKAISRAPVEFRVGTDALAVVVNPENTWLDEGVTLAELAKIFSAEAKTWADVNPAWPKEPIQRFSPGTDSGTFDYFVEAVMAPTFGDIAKGEEEILKVDGIQLSEDDNVLVQGVEGSKNGIGYFGYAYYQENADKLKALKINGVAPSGASVDANTYPLARPLFIYSDPKILAEKPQVADFINFYLTYVNDEIDAVGYFPASETALNVARGNWWQAAKGGVPLPEVDAGAVTGDIVSAGSSTVFPLSEAMAARFQDEGYTGNITIDSIGSGAGFERFCKTGETDIANASRAIKSSEVESCKAIGRAPVEFRVGTDALAVVVNPENTWLDEGVTLEELAKIFSAEATTWADVNPAWPAEPIQRFSPGTDSGTFDYFVEAVMAPTFGDIAKGEEEILKVDGIQLSEDDNVLVQGVEGSKNGIGYFGYAYYQENADKLKALKINGVAPSGASVDANTYPLARPLFMYSDPKILQEKPQVADFINFYLTYVNDEIDAVGYFPASESALNASRLALMNALAGK
jgi:phosphate transport system substrate-binding protein